ncbi:hypothetical protein ENUP19_0080G0010 [Entamoeba nuttalli]|uniref:Dolichyl-diphosphooligosaccharide--protein glycosyltransferase subunit 1 n=2 Tax=Entamoeba nuttalli TaxID=412467 RepID=K2GQQ7_ENTNP|nr:dolychil-diphosphooligosaccharide-- protein glycosyltransferase subunit, putative [Entamoeba nuttalli P19]EKE37288.1 dolychil-diphosphooligosaccharide-- protein glycosyltransferase subunit, putative [Entamoeba nuttalli P19]|eukprot:XP_008860386.1 dolychil-diphosphooligosaccharide-- protein glycosyltransferase subunit, putative [Entamoeba nuttalli P19]
MREMIWKVIVIFLVKAVKGAIINEIIEGELNIEKINPTFSYSIDFTSDEPIRQYTMLIGKEILNKQEIILELPNITSGIINCRENHIGFTVKRTKTKSLLNEYIMRYQGNLCPMSFYKTIICIINVYCLQSQIISKAPFYQVITNINNNIQRFILEDYVGTKDHWFFIDFYSFIDPIQIELIQKFISIEKNNQYFIEEHFINVKNIGNELDGPFERIQYEEFINESVCLKKLQLKLPLESQIDKYYDSTGIIYGYSSKINKNNNIITIQPRYPLLGGWSTSFSINYHYKFINNNLNILEIPLITNSFPIGVLNYSISIKLPFGMNIKKYWFNPACNNIFSFKENHVFGPFSYQKIQVELNNIVLDQNQIYLMIEYDTVDSYYQLFIKIILLTSLLVIITLINYLTL